ncbi:MAG TPA: hypothetical protein VJ063_20955 [Verrucomicrobiae bacterium]|nr:hypothetical protein [Verrucomicrobiae bacterium]
MSALTLTSDSLDRGECAQAVDILRAFQGKVAVQLGARDPALARELVHAAERIIASLP